MWLWTKAKSWLQGRWKYLCWGHKKGTIWVKKKLLQEFNRKNAITELDHFFTVFYYSAVLGDNTETTCIHFTCMHTLYLPRKGCLPPLINMSSSRSSMHLTGRPVLSKDTFIRQSLKCTIQFLQGKALLFLVSTVFPERQWGVWGKLLGLHKQNCKIELKTKQNKIKQINTLEAGTS